MAMVENTHEAGCATQSAQVRVWDIGVRLFHWSLVSFFVLAWLTADEWDAFHEIAGYAVGGLIGFRVIWGFVGSRHARFSDFVRGPAAVFAYLRDMRVHKAKRYLGHNPAGGAMIIALIVMLATITASGIAMTMDMFWGVEWVEEVHETAVNLTLLLVVLHVAGVVHAGLAHKENLVRAMITGMKRKLS